MIPGFSNTPQSSAPPPGGVPDAPSAPSAQDAIEMVIETDVSKITENTADRNIKLFGGSE